MGVNIVTRLERRIGLKYRDLIRHSGAETQERYEELVTYPCWRRC